MTEAEACRATDRIRGHFDSARQLIHQAHTGRVWEPLGYPTWMAYVQAEFAESQRYIEYQKKAADIETILRTKVRENMKIGDTPERHLRPLVALIREPERLCAAWKLAQARGNGQVTGKIVAEAFAEVQAHYTPAAGAAKDDPHGEDDAPGPVLDEDRGGG
jgi:hypothetical protein